MAFKLVDRVRESTISPGTGTATLAGAALGYQTFSAGVGANNTTYYVIADQSGANWEVGYGTVGAGGTTLARTTVLSSSNSGSLVNFSSGTQDVWVDYPATKAVFQDSTGTVSVPVLLTTSTTNTTPNLSFNASNTGFSVGASVSGSYLQSLLQNKSGTAGASANYVLSNDLGTDSTYYGEFGMNSSVYSSGTPSDFFSINNGIYFSGHDGDITFGSGNGFKSYFAWGSSGQSAHVINAVGALGFSTNLGTTPALSGTTGYGTSGQVPISAGSAGAVSWSSTPTLTGTNFTGVPISTAISGLGTGVASALAIAIGSAGAPVTFNGALGTPSSGTLTNTTGFPAANLAGTALPSAIVSSSLTSVGTIGTGTWQGSLIGATYGGTGQSTVTTGDLLYGSATNTWSKLGIGATGTILRVVSGLPAWGTDYTGTVTSVSGTGSVNGITLTGTVTASGSLTLGGTLSGIANSQLTNSSISINGNSVSLGGSYTVTSANVSDQANTSTGYFSLPLGTTAQRPTPSQAGGVRMNSSTGTPEWYSSVASAWVAFNAAAPYLVNYLVVAGGGGGGGTGNGSNIGYAGGGGGGAGGLRSTVTATGGGGTLESAVYFVSGTTYTVTVGAGGSGGTYLNSTATNGGSSSISGTGLTTISTVGGGGVINGTGQVGGSGGGAYGGAAGGAAGTANQGYAGSPSGSGDGGCAGGGAGGTGTTVSGTTGATGGTGVAVAISGSSTYYAGGGGGGGYQGSTSGGGGNGGGGSGGGNAGGTNTGRVGGGARMNNQTSGLTGGGGGSGVVILSVPTANYSGKTTGSPTVTTSGSNTILTFTGSGTYTA